MKKHSLVIAHLAMAAARILGGASLLLLVIILFFGPIHFIDLHLPIILALILDGFLCLAFFVQHSLMVRKSFQDRLGRYVPQPFHGAIYSIISGVVLFALLFFWQPVAPIIISVSGLLRWLLRGVFITALFGFVWGVRALDSFDAFGVQPLKASLYGKRLKALPLIISGPYRWVRHPQYLLVLILLWCYPDLTVDRLFLNSAWTIWVFFGAALEERDLISVFGEAYQNYQRKVPMLIPWRIPR